MPDVGYRTFNCEVCGEDFDHPRQRGRPPKRCAKHREIKGRSGAIYSADTTSVTRSFREGPGSVLACPTHGQVGVVGATIKRASAWCKQCGKWYDQDGKVAR